MRYRIYLESFNLIVNVSLINRVMLENIQTMKIVNVEKNQLISQLKNVMKKLMENEMIYNDYGNVCNSCTTYIVLFAIAFLIIIGISSAFIFIGI